MAGALPKYSDSDFSDDDTSELDTNFNEAVHCVRKNTGSLTNDQLLELYGLYKQGTEGTCNVSKPSWWDAKGGKKWDAWHALGDLTKDQAKEQYVQLVQKYCAQTSNSANKSCESKKETWVTVSSLQKSSEPDLLHHEMSLIDAARENCATRIKELLIKNPELKEERDESGLTALHWAADRNATDALTAAIEAGCPVNAIDDNGQTALHYAATCGHIESTKILLKAGALLLKDEDDCTPLDVASDDKIRDILENVTAN